MPKAKWASALVRHFGVVLAVGALSIVSARTRAHAHDTCKNHGGRIADLMQRVAEVEEIVRLRACNDSSTNLRSVAVGFKCRTSKGAIYERVARDKFGEAWRGPDGLIWGDFVGSYSQHDALTACTKLGGTLPLRADFERGEADGFREVLPNMKSHWFWSSSAHPNSADYAYAFSGLVGSVTSFYHIHKHSVRCAGR